MSEPIAEHMQKSVNSVRKELTKVRTGIATPALLDSIMVEYYGSATPVNQVANVSIPEPRTIAIQPWEKDMLGPIEKAIQASDLGITPSNDGTYIRLNLPILTADRRKELAKLVHKIGEDGKVAIRNIRRDENERIKKEGKSDSLSEDVIKSQLEDVQKVTDKYIGIVDQVVSEKEKDILTV